MLMSGILEACRPNCREGAETADAGVDGATVFALSCTRLKLDGLAE